MNYKHFLSSFLMCLCISSSALMAETTAMVSSPNGQLRLNFEVIGSKPTYSVDFIGNKVIENSPLGFVANIGDFTDEISLEKSVTAHKEYDYSVPTIKKSNVHVNANQLVVTLKNRQGHRFDVEFMVGDNNVAFRLTSRIRRTVRSIQSAL